MAFLANKEKVGNGDGDDNNMSDDNHISKKQKCDCSSDNIYIDDIMERAQWSVFDYSCQLHSNIFTQCMHA